MESYKRFAALIALALAALITGCGGGEPVKSDTVLSGPTPPAWITTGAGAYSDAKGRAFFGVGSSSGIKNRALLRSNADNRARAEVSKIFQFYTAALMRDYLASKQALEPLVSDEERRVEQAMRDLTSSALSDVVIAEQWQNTSTGELHALARLDLKAFIKSAQGNQAISEALKGYIKDNAEKLHSELGAGFELQR